MTDYSEYIAPIVVEESCGKTKKLLTSAYFDKTLKQKQVFDTPEQLIDKLGTTVSRVSLFSTKVVDTDEFTGIHYPNSIDEDEIDLETLKSKEEGYFRSKKITGSNTFTSFNYGVILFHSSNKLLFNYSVLEFMIKNYGIPIKFTSFDISKVYKFKRSNGDINIGMIKENSSLRISRSMNKVIINIKFDDKSNIEEDTEYFYNSITYLEKSVPLKDFMELNGISSFSIEVPNYYEKYTSKLSQDKIKCPCKIDENILVLINTHYYFQVYQHLQNYKVDFDKEDFKTTLDKMSLTLEL